MNWEKDEFIKNIRYKLHDGIKLNETEIDFVISAIIKAKGYTQKPYFELVYHDEYDRKERRIMQPEYSRIDKDRGFYVQKSAFSLVFNRTITEEEMEEINGYQEN